MAQLCLKADFQKTPVPKLGPNFQNSCVLTQMQVNCVNKQQQKEGNEEQKAAKEEEKEEDNTSDSQKNLQNKQYESNLKIILHQYG